MGLFDFLRGGTPQDRFAQRVIKRLEQRGYDKALRYDPVKFELTADDGAVTYLGNIYRDWVRYPASERRAALDSAFDFLFEIEADNSWEAVRELLLPIIRNRTHMGMYRLAASGRTEEAGVTPFAEHLELQIAVDRPRSIALVDSQQLRSWDRTPDEVFQIAIDNLRAKSPCRFELLPGGFHVSAFGDFHDASRLTLPHLFEMLPLRGAPVAVAATRECVTVAGRDDPAALAAMARFVDAALADETRPISYAPLVLQGEVWRPLIPSPDDPPELLELVVKQQFWDYACQTEAMEARFERTGRDVYVAPFEVLDDRGRGRTWTSWTEGVPALLPKAEVLALTSADGRKLGRLWTDVEDVCGPFEQDPDAYPPRFLSKPWPSDAEWSRLLSEHRHPSWFP